MTTDYQAQFNELKTSLIASLKGYFPIIGRKHQLEVGDIWVDDNLSIRDFPAQIEAYEKKGDFSVPVYASLVLRNIDGSVIEKRNKLKIMSMPKVTSRGTYMLGGNEYQVPYQLRLKPNVYNRIKDNGELETFINIKPVALHLYLDPEKATFSLRFGSQKKVSLYPFLSGLGVSDAEMAASWGQDIVDMNRNSRGNPQSEVYKFFEMAFNRSPANMQEAVEGCLMYLAEKELDKEGTKLTIGRSHERLSTQVLLDSAKKLVSLNRKEEEPDERDAIHFKKIVHVEDFLKDRLENEKRSLIFKIKQRLDSKESIREILKPDVFDTPIHTFFTTSSSSNHANTLNPLSMLAEARKVTIMGEGGIEDENAITEDARAVHPSQLGFIDPIHTPEGGNIGSVNQLALIADKKGNELITRLINLKTNKYDEVTPSKASQSIVAFSDQFENKNGVFKPKYKTVKASIRNQIGMVDPKEVDYIMTNDKQIFSFASNMTPFINHISGNRSMMSGKHMEQAVPLKFREAPLVQNKLTSNKTFEQHLSDEVETAAEINGTVTKISKDKITIEGPNGPMEHFIYNKFINPTDKVYMHHEPLVSVGDKVKKGQPLTKSNYSDNGSYAIGTNMTVAFTPYKGYTFEDGVAVSESAAKKLTSLHMYKEKVEIDANSILDKKKFLAYFPTKITGDNFSKLGDDGVIKEGSIVRQNDYLVAHLHKEEYTKEDMLIASFNKKFLKPYKDRSIVWEEDFEGKVVRVIRRPKEIEVQIETEEAARVGDKLCYDENTDVLTSLGWKKIEDVSLDDEICCLDGDRIKYMSPSAIHKYSTGDKMYRIESQQVDLFVTENHNMYICDRDSNKFRLAQAKEIYGKRVSYKKNGIWIGNNINNITVPSITVIAGQYGHGTRTIPSYDMLMDDYMFILGCFLSEGNIVNRKRNGEYRIKITQKKEAGRIEFEKEANIRNIKYNKYKDHYTITSKQLIGLFEGFGSAKDKFIPNWVFELSSDKLKTLFKWLMWGDGHSACGKPICYTTTSNKLADDIQRLCLHIGFSANYKQKLGFRFEFIRGKEYLCNPIYDVRIITTKNTPTVNHGHVKTQKIQKEYFVENYARPVYCVTVPTGVLYVRRNGKPVFSGNSGRAGNKGIITHIIPDNEVPQTESGQPIDVFLNPHGIVGRINPAQILESYAGRIAEKVGTPYVVDNFSGENYFEKINSEITKLKIPEKEFLTDKAGNKIIENPIAVGKMHVLKLNHPVRKKFQAREDRSYTIDMQPTSGGGEGGRKMDQLSIYSMLSHGATKNLQESMTYKGEKNDEFWHAYQAGLPLPKPKVPFVFDKFQSMLKASGINMERFGDQFQVMPLTSDGIKSISNGEIQEPEFVQGKNLNTIKGGLFDPDVTGGREGTKWSHVTLSEAMPNPVFEGAILSVLEMKKDDYDQIIGGKKYVDKFGFINNEGRGVTGGEAIKTLLSKINVDQQILSATETAKTAKDSELNRVHRKLRYLKALKKLDMSPSVYVTNTVPVIPPIFRPITPDKGNRLNISPANTLYRDMMLINGQLKKAKENGLPDSEVSELRKNLYKAYGSLVGTEKGITDTNQKEQQGFIQLIAGKKPKEGFFQDKMLAKRQDFSGTSTVVPEPGYGLDDIGIPYDMLWSTYKPHVIRRLQQLGYTPNAAIKEVEERTTLAKSILDQETQERPVIINRAPSLHKFSLLSFKPRPVEGKAIKVNPLIVGGFNMDFDGDTVGVHVPISEDAKIEAHKMLASNNIFDPQTSGIVHKPQSEHVTGLYMMTTPGEKSGKKYKDFETAIADYKAGNLKINNVISVAGRNLTLGIALVNSALPNEYRDYEKPMDGKRLKSVLFEIAKNKPGEYGHVVSQLKNLGNEAIDKLGLTSGLSDLRIDYAERDKIVQEAKALVESKGAESADALVKKLDDFSNSQLRKNHSMLSTMIDSGGTGKASAIRQMVATPFITVDHRNKPIPMVISKSYTEGLDAGDYFSTLSGARRGMMDRALSVKEPGAFTKEIINTVIGTVIRENDCGTKSGIDVPVSEKIHLIGRYTTDGRLVDEAFLKKYTGLTVKVRSPLTCESQNPPCAKCFGLDETGKNLQLGTYLGAVAGQSLTEPGTQLVMKKFHTGGALASNAYESDTFHKGFERVKEVLELPKVLRDKSTLSTVSGVVSQINPAPQGGWFVYVGSTEHYVPGRLHVLVKAGQHVEKGDKIGSGAVKPQELAVLKNPLEAKKYMVDELAKAYQDQGRTIRRPLFETVVSSLVSKAQITDPGKSDFVPGDYANINKIDALNKDGAKIKATPVFSGLNQAPLHDEDFIARLNFRHLKETLVEAPAQAWYSELHGTNPIPGLVYGAEFGTKKASKKDSLLDVVRKRREAFAESGTLGDKDTSAAKDTSDNRTVITAPTNY